MTYHDEAQALQRETAVWNALVAGDAEADASLLADDFLGVYESGFAGKQSHVGQLGGGPTIASYSLSEVDVRQLAPDLVLIAYRARFTRRPGDAPQTMFVTSIWRRDEPTWRNVFSQDTPAR